MKERVLIDIDGTICIGAMLELCEEYLGEKIDITTIPVGLYINQVIDSLEFRKYFLGHNVYDYGITEQYTIDSIRELSSIYDVYIATIYHYPDAPEFSSIMLPRKLEYLKKYFSFLGEKKFLFVGDKSVLDFDISIGDSLSDMIGKKDNFLLTTYHNKDINDDELKNRNITRVDDWKDIMDNLMNVKNAGDFGYRKKWIKNFGSFFIKKTYFVHE